MRGLAAITAAILFAGATVGCSGRPLPDRATVVWWECAAVELDLSGTIVLIDPWFPFAREADAVLVTHLHYDHFSPGTIARVRGASGERMGLIVGPRQIAGPLREIGRGKERIAGAGETIRFRNLVIETVPAEEDGRDDLGYLVRDARTGLRSSDPVRRLLEVRAEVVDVLDPAEMRIRPSVIPSAAQLKAAVCSAIISSKAYFFEPNEPVRSRLRRL